MNKQEKSSNDYLYKAFLQLKTEKECEEFLKDLCTPTEVASMAQRLQVATLLKKGATYNDIAKETKASTATISRINRAFVVDGCGGFELIYKRLEEK